MIAKKKLSKTPYVIHILLEPTHIHTHHTRHTYTHTTHTTHIPPECTLCGTALGGALRAWWSMNRSNKQKAKGKVIFKPNE